ncbi:hypothetical protein [Nannocystis pusilla]|uniref:hypothetical protein n=1 Tax=Nannocystis pusilla TaxID=889268 RepID=UPI003B7BEFBB
MLVAPAVGSSVVGPLVPVGTPESESVPVDSPVTPVTPVLPCVLPVAPVTLVTPVAWLAPEVPSSAGPQPTLQAIAPAMALIRRLRSRMIRFISGQDRPAVEGVSICPERQVAGPSGRGP